MNDETSDLIDMLERPQMVSTIRVNPNKMTKYFAHVYNKPNFRDTNYKEIELDGLMLQEYNTILMKLEMEKKKPPKGYKVLDFRQDNVKALYHELACIIEKTCSNCRGSHTIVKSVYTPVFVIHLCSDCLQVYEYTLKDFMDPD